ncbi:glucokinase, partial [Streptomyces sp. Agncl-13]|uniref:glucokinase n=1 Tax=Streptomyces sp. Agncl-13 TaxID=3400628 RepID=UPI003A8AD16B
MSIGKTGQILLADIGGTNARFALSQGDGMGPIDYVKVADFPTVREAIADVLARRAGAGRPGRA